MSKKQNLVKVMLVGKMFIQILNNLPKFFSSPFLKFLGALNILQHPAAKEMHQQGGGELTQQKMLLMKKATVRVPWLIVHRRNNKMWRLLLPLLLILLLLLTQSHKLF